METNSNNIKIFIIDDDPGDIKLITRAVKKFDATIEVKSFMDGESVFNYFKNEDSDTPNLVLLDLNLPKISGIEILKFLKSNEDISCIPIIILTTSNADSDVNNCYKNFASGYLRKPTTIKVLEEKIEIMLSYWLKICLLPNKNNKELF